MVHIRKLINIVLLGLSFGFTLSGKCSDLEQHKVRQDPCVSSEAQKKISFKQRSLSILKKATKYAFVGLATCMVVIHMARLCTDGIDSVNVPAVDYYTPCTIARAFDSTFFANERSQVREDRAINNEIKVSQQAL